MNKLYLTDLEEFINLLCENKWTNLVKAGKLSTDSLRRIQKYRPEIDKFYVKQLLKNGQDQKAQRYLHKKGIVKSAREWLQGVEQGSKNILKKYDGKTVYNTKRILGSYASRNQINIAKRFNKKNLGGYTLVKRHEVDELRTMGNQNKKLSNPMFNFLKSTNGQHASDEVLRKERKLTNYGSSLYGKKYGINKLSKLRSSTKEYDILLPKNKIRKIDRKKIRKGQEFKKNLIILKKKY